MNSKKSYDDCNSSSESSGSSMIINIKMIVILVVNQIQILII